jgi:hypothetical protein
MFKDVPFVIHGQYGNIPEGNLILYYVLPFSGVDWLDPQKICR